MNAIYVGTLSTSVYEIQYMWGMECCELECGQESDASVRPATMEQTALARF